MTSIICRLSYEAVNFNRVEQIGESMQPLSPLHRAAQKGDVEKLRFWVQKVGSSYLSEVQ